MKKFKLTLILLLVSQGVFSLDFGLDLGAYASAFTGEQEAFNSRDRASLWFTNTTALTDLQLAGFYEFSAQFSPDFQDVLVRPWRLDLDQSYMTWLLPGLLEPNSMSSLTLGRLELTDTVGKIHKGLSDGLLLTHKVRTLETRFYSAYTGLLSKDDANIILSASDFYESEDPEVTYAPKKILAGGGVKFLEILDRTDLNIDLSGQFDLRTQDRVHTQYLGLSLDSRPLRWLKWRTYLITEIWDQSPVQVSLSAGARLQFSYPESGVVLVQSLDWASGTGGVLRQYAPVNQVPIGDVYAVPFSDLLTTRTQILWKPAAGFVTGISGYTFIRTSSNPGADKFLPLDSNAPYLGLEVSGDAEWKLTSELSLTGKAGIFVPNRSSSAYPADAPLRTKASIEVKFQI